MIDNEGLKREIGVWGLVANSINIIVGAGIFILPVLIAERLGTASIWAYLICGLLMVFIMLCFTEAGTIITRTGGAYSYIEDAFGKYAGFLTTNIFIFGAALMATAAVANGLVGTLAYFLPIFKVAMGQGIIVCRYVWRTGNYQCQRSYKCHFPGQIQYNSQTYAFAADFIFRLVFY